MSDWTKWGGGECPVPDDTVVAVRYADGSELEGPAYMLVWWHAGGKSGAVVDIQAYRIIERGES